MTKQVLEIILIVVSSLLTAAILMQSKGAGLSSAFGGENLAFGTKRGMEKSLFYATIVLAVIFLGLAFVAVLV